MKKVGIITYHRYYNYGTALQAYALQKAIDNIEGYQAELIDFRLHDEKQLSRWQLILLRIRRIPAYIKEWKRVKAIKKYSPEFAKKKPFFDEFFKNVFVTSPTTYHTFAELKKSAPEYDIMVTGSDQTWSPQIGFHPALFLEFGNPKAMRIAYAPSIGVSKFTEEEAKYINAHLQSYDAISCRESLGTKVLQECVKGKEIVNVLDPTFLLRAEDWDKIAETPQVKGDYILCYFIGHKTYYREIATQLSQDLGMPLYFIPVSWQDMGKGNNLLPESGPREFLGLIREARLVLTDSFHGTAFSINYHKSFYSFTKIEGGKSASDNSRLYDILSKLHLEDRLIDTKTKINFTDVDYSEASKLLEAERSKSSTFLSNALIDTRICAHVECTGCMACEAACNHGAMLVEKDLMGFHYSTKDLSKCVDCGLCVKLCPNNNPKLAYNQTLSAFVATAKERNEMLTSTSGGVASVLSRYIIRNGGVVYGCTSKDARHICHIRIDKEEDVQLLKGSKYVQSDMRGIMKQVKEDLKAGLQVLFIGTPCQVAGIQSLTNGSNENLITVDFVCHGVPSQQLFSDIVAHEYPQLKDTEMKADFRFRDETNHSKYGVKLSDAEGKTLFYETYPNDSRYISGFLGGMYYRESCYQCHYARGERVSDLTLGDYWDREGQYAEMGHEGLSMVMANTSKGERLLDSIDNEVILKPIAKEILHARNAQLRNPMPHHPDYDGFKLQYMNDSYNQRAIDILDKEIKRVKKHQSIAVAAERIKRIVIGRMAIKLIKRVRKTSLQ